MALLVGDDPFTQRDQDVSGRIGAPAFALRSEIGHRLDVAPGHVEIAVRRQRKAEVRVAKRQHVIVDAQPRMLGERLPAIADIYAAELQPLEQSRLIGYVDIGLGIH